MYKMSVANVQNECVYWHMYKMSMFSDTFTKLALMSVYTGTCTK